MNILLITIAVLVLCGCEMQSARHDILYCIGACILVQEEEPRRSAQYVKNNKQEVKSDARPNAN